MHICSYVYISHEATDMRESWHTFECVMAHIWMSQDTDLCQGSFTKTAQIPKHKWWCRCGNVLRRCKGCRCFLSCYRALYTLGSFECMRSGLFWVNINRALSHNQKLTKDRGGVEGRKMPSCLLHTLNHAPHTHGALLQKKTWLLIAAVSRLLMPLCSHATGQSHSSRLRQAIQKGGSHQGAARIWCHRIRGGGEVREGEERWGGGGGEEEKEQWRQHTAARCNTLQLYHAVTHCNTLKHTATHIRTHVHTCKHVYTHIQCNTYTTQHICGHPLRCGLLLKQQKITYVSKRAQFKSCRTPKDTLSCSKRGLWISAKEPYISVQERKQRSRKQRERQCRDLKHSKAALSSCNTLQHTAVHLPHCNTPLQIFSTPN